VKHTVRVNLPSGDRVDRIVVKRDGALAGACARARNVEHGDSTVVSSYEAVTDAVGIEVVPRDGPWRVDGLGDGPLSWRINNMNRIPYFSVFSAKCLTRRPQ
jgi:hypothetical protein